jgi:hypothetical protein
MQPKGTAMNSACPYGVDSLMLAAQSFRNPNSQGPTNMDYGGLPLDFGQDGATRGLNLQKLNKCLDIALEVCNQDDITLLQQGGGASALYAR